jgi:hypothetical protein
MTRKSAEDLLRELESNPAWVRERDARDATLAKRAAELAADERELISNIRAAGYDVDSVYDLVNNAPHPVLQRRFVGPYPNAYSVLVQHLSVPHAGPIREGIVRALTVRDVGPSVSEALLNGLRRETDSGLRWVFANALRVAMPVRQWRKHPEIIAALNAPPTGSATRPSNDR